MTERVWHKGPPPHVGWWNASADRADDVWRWWNGRHWSFAAYPYHDKVDAEEIASHCSILNVKRIEWTDYYPENARVPRIDPRKL